MLPIRDNREDNYLPILAWTLIALNIIIFVWDRNGRIFAGNVVFSDLMLRPQEVVSALRGGDWFPMATLFTSQFLHADLFHLISNLIFLLVFGGAIESAFGPLRFMLYYLFWGLAASAAHIYVSPESITPSLGASGAIGGILGSYFLLFPANKVEVWTPFGFFEVSAWILLGIWFLYQIFVPQYGVANWAHAGGFMTGMLTVLIAGGRDRILASANPITKP